MSKKNNRLKTYQYHLPLREPLRLKQGLYTAREGLILNDQNGSYGEVAPFPGLSQENLEDCLKALAQPHQAILPPALAWGLYMLNNPLMPLAEPLEWPVNALLSGDHTHQLLESAEALAQDGYRILKLKVGLGPLSEDIFRVNSLSKMKLKLRLDANRSWDLNTAQEFVSQLSESALQQIDYLEEPLANPKLYLRFRQTCFLRIALDETLAQNLAPELLKIPDVFVLKPMLLGPQRLLELIKQAAGRQLVFSSVFESGLGLRYLALLSQRTPGAVAAGLDTWRYLADDLWEPNFIIKKGRLNFSDNLFTQPLLLRLKWVRQTA